jgi:hypothetical protein
MQRGIDAYFAYEDQIALNISILPVYTMSGLALSLGMDRRSLVNYANRDEFFLTIKTARAKVEHCIEHLMLTGKGNPAGCIFNLKNNFGWKDTTTLAGDRDNPLTTVNEITIRFFDAD